MKTLSDRVGDRNQEAAVLQGKRCNSDNVVDLTRQLSNFRAEVCRLLEIRL